MIQSRQMYVCMYVCKQAKGEEGKRQKGKVRVRVRKERKERDVLWFGQSSICMYVCMYVPMYIDTSLSWLIDWMGLDSIDGSIMMMHVNLPI